MNHLPQAKTNYTAGGTFTSAFGKSHCINLLINSCCDGFNKIKKSEYKILRKQQN